MKVLGMIVMLLTVVGALNWGLVGVGEFFDYNLNLVNLLVGTWPIVESVVYMLVGVSGVLAAIGLLTGKCNACKQD